MKFKGWEKVRIKNDTGEEVDAIAPLIISASRSTDIPAFYSGWFFNRLQKGYVRWVNPFNRRSQYVSFEKVRLIVFWSKNPLPLMPFLDEMDRRNIRYMIQFTLNDYEADGLEVDVPSLQSRIAAFRTFSERAGKDCVLWRFDPLILTDKITPGVLIKKISNTGDSIAQYTSRLTISFVVEYVKVIKSLKRAGFTLNEFDAEAIEQIGSALMDLSRKWGIDVYSCAMKAELDKYGIMHGACIDPYHIADVFGDDPILRGFCSTGAIEQTGLFAVKNRLLSKELPLHPLKDPGQRENCRCIASKDIGSYDTCPHFCTYCYANSSLEKVMLNKKRASLNNDSLNEIE